MEKKLVSWFDLIAAKKVECLFDTYLQATNVWSHSTYQKRYQHKCLLLQLRKHNIAKNYSKENQELQIKSSRIVNMIKHFISSPETSFYILWIFQMPLTPFKRERGLKKNRRKNTKPTLVDTSTWTHSKDGPQTIQTPFKVSRKAGAGMVCVVVIIKCLKYSRKTMGKKPLLR